MDNSNGLRAAVIDPLEAGETVTLHNAYHETSAKVRVNKNGVLSARMYRRACRERFDGCLGISRIQSGTQVTDLGNRRAATTVQIAIDHQTSTNASAYGDKENDPPPLPCPELGFPQGRAIAIVAEHGWHAESLFAPGCKWKVIPATDLVALDHSTGRTVDRSTEADSDPIDFVSSQQFCAGIFDLSQDAGRAPRDVDISPLETHER